MSEQRKCDFQMLCILDGDYIIYAISDNFGEDIITIKHTFEELTNTEIKVIEERVSKEGKEITEFTINPITGFMNNVECCTPYPYIYPTPLTTNSMLNSIEQIRIVSETPFEFDELNRTGVIATNSKESYLEIIDKDTGLLFGTKQTGFNIIPLWQKTDLIDTNIFQRDSGIQFEELVIPKWWMQNVRLYLYDQISDIEYLNALEYLVETNVIRV